MIPSDGEVVEGIASVDESAITGESAPVIREAGGDRSGVTGGTRVISDRIIVKITALPGQAFLDRMIALVEGAVRQKTPNEIALTLVLSGLTLAFLIVVIPIWPMAWNAEQYMMGYLGLAAPLKSLGTDVPTLVALLVCLIPTTIGALLAAIGIAGMDRALQANIIAKSGKSVETAGDIDTVLLDKTGTITVGNRRATDFVADDWLFPTQTGAAWRRLLRSRRDSGRQKYRHRGAGDRSRIQRVERADRSAIHRFQCPDPDERRRFSRRQMHSQRRPRCGHRICPTERMAEQFPPGCNTPSTRSLQRRYALGGRREFQNRRSRRIGGHPEAWDAESGSSGCAGWACARS